MDEFDYMKYTDCSGPRVFAYRSEFTTTEIPPSVSLNTTYDPCSFNHCYFGNIGSAVRFVKIEHVPFNDTKFKETITTDIGIYEVFHHIYMKQKLFMKMVWI